MYFLSWSRNSPHFIKHGDHFGVHNSPSFIPVLSQMKSVQDLPSCLFQIHFNVILQFIPGSSKWSPSFSPPDENPEAFIFSPMRVTRAAHLIPLALYIVILT